MRILVVTQWFPPEPRELFLQLAQGLQNDGNEVLVVTGFPNWPGGKIYPGYRIKLWQREVIEGVRVLRLPLFPDHGTRALKRALNLTSLAISLALLGPFLIRRPKLIYVVQLPTIAASAWWLSIFWRSKFILEVQDLWPESLSASGMATGGRVNQIVGRLCSWAYRKAASIRVISNGFRKNLIGKGVPENKIKVIPNWIELGADGHSSPSLREKLGLEGKFALLYAGSIGRPQGLSILLEAAENLRDRPDIVILLAGDGVERESIMEAAKTKGLTNIRYLGAFAQAEMGAVYDAADCLLVHLVPNPLFAITIPSKIVSCLAAGKPILAGLEGDPLEAIMDAGAGVAFEPGSGASLAEALSALASLPEEERIAMGQRGREAAQRSFSAERVLPQISAMAKEAVQ